MAVGERHPWIVAYDISDRRRLARVHRLMLCRGVPMQLSLFRANMNALEAKALRREIEKLIDPREDDVRLYALPAEPEITQLGRDDLVSGATFVE